MGNIFSLFEYRCPMCHAVVPRWRQSQHQIECLTKRNFNQEYHAANEHRTGYSLTRAHSANAEERQSNVHSNATAQSHPFRQTENLNDASNTSDIRNAGERQSGVNLNANANQMPSPVCQMDFVQIPGPSYQTENLTGASNTSEHGHRHSNSARQSHLNSGRQSHSNSERHSHSNSERPRCSNSERQRNSHSRQRGSTSTDHVFKLGDIVKISLPIDTVHVLTNFDGVWNEEITDLIDKPGTVVRSDEEYVRVEYDIDRFNVDVSQRIWVFRSMMLKRVCECNGWSEKCYLCRDFRNRESVPLHIEINRLRKQLTETEENQLCQICRRRKKDIAYAPCGHGACAKCSRTNTSRCHICHEYIYDRMRICV